ncbi:hypothetical protein E2C01_042650 [Portunus trituberculatus]|uniref:Uncharacterized protein n=1 Tax=Portunus trituberculatus TaxID=210409 RepID=A0A5B7FX30_PORTR|nr:hypothetical protein [Portunus trituberculatus]
MLRLVRLGWVELGSSPFSPSNLSSILSSIFHLLQSFFLPASRTFILSSIFPSIILFLHRPFHQTSPLPSSRSSTFQHLHPPFLSPSHSP